MGRGFEIKMSDWTTIDTHRGTALAAKFRVSIKIRKNHKNLLSIFTFFSPVKALMFPPTD
jgi:hypothetical protein